MKILRTVPHIYITFSLVFIISVCPSSFFGGISLKAQAQQRPNPSDISVKDQAQQGAVRWDDGKIISAGDTLMIRSSSHPELDGERVVSSSGTILLPYAGEIKIQGQTTRIAAQTISEILSKGFLRNAVISVEMAQSYQPVYILGQVKNGGIISWFPGLTLLKAMALANLDSPLRGIEVRIIRKNKILIASPWDAFTVDPLLDIPIYADDIIAVTSNDTIRP